MLDRLHSDVAVVAAVVSLRRAGGEYLEPVDVEADVQLALAIVTEAYARVFAGGIHERVARRAADLQRAADLAKAAELNAAIVDPGEGEGVSSS